MTTITLSGGLGEALGRTQWDLAVESVSEALRALEALTGKLYNHLRETSTKGIEYRVRINGEDHKHIDELKISSENLRSVEIIPVPSGAKGGLWQSIIGVVLIIIGVVVSAIPGFQTVGSLIVKIGVALLVGGITQLLTKAPTLSTNPRQARQFIRGPEDSSSSQQDAPPPSYLFAGVTNTARQGTIVPIGYGRMIVGSQLVSYSVTNAQINYSLGAGTPANSDPFFDLPFWDTFEADPRAQYVQTPAQIRRYNKAETLEAADQLGLRTGHATANTSALKKYLKYCSELFVHHQDLTIKEARALYDWIGLTSLSSIVPKHRRFQDYVTALSQHYINETP